MSIAGSYTRLLECFARVTEFGLNWFVQSSLLLALGLSIGWLLRRRGSATQSAVYRTTLAAVLVCPFATAVLAFQGISGYSIDLPAAWSYSGVPETSSAADVMPAVRSRDVTQSTAPVELKPYPTDVTDPVPSCELPVTTPLFAAGAPRHIPRGATTVGRQIGSANSRFY